MTIGHGFIGKRINGKVLYTDYDWAFLIDLKTPGKRVISHYRKAMNKQWFKDNLYNKKFGWNKANTMREYLSDPADYHILLKGNSILLWDRNKKRFVSVADEK